MDGRFLTLKKIVITGLTAIMILAQSGMAFAIPAKAIPEIASSKIVMIINEMETKRVPTEVTLRQLEEKQSIKVNVQQNFEDVKPSDWFYNDVLKARELGLIAGVGNNRFAPNKHISYAEFITVLIRILGIDVSKYPSGNHWASQNIEAAKALNIITEFEIINYDAGIPREDMAKFTCRALGIEPVLSDEIVFADAAKNISAEERGFINTAYKEYLIEGIGRSKDGGRLFGYGQTVNRAQLATMALRIKAYKEDKEAYKQERAAVRQAEEAKWQEMDSWRRLGESGGITSESQLTPEIIEKIKSFETASYSGIAHKIGSGDGFKWGNPPGDEENKDWLGAIRKAFPGKSVVTCRELCFGDAKYYEYYYRVIVDGRELWRVEVGYNTAGKPAVFMGYFEDENIFDDKYDPYGYKMMQPREGVYRYEK